MSGYLMALLLTIAIEVPTVAAFFPGQRLRLALACLLVTTATHFIVFQLLLLAVRGAALLIIGETFALVAEASTYAALGRPRDLPRSLMASAAANGFSFAAGLLLPLLL